MVHSEFLAKNVIVSDIFGQQKNLVKKNWVKKLGKINIEQKRPFRVKNFWSRKIFGQEKFLIKKIFWSRKIFFDKKYFI